jgi:hypothetical protein
MTPNTKRAIVEELLSQLEGETRGNLPAVFSPKTNQVAWESGHWGLFSRFFDPLRRLFDHHRQRRLEIELQTGTDLLEIKAGGTKDKAKIQTEAEIADYQHKAQWWRATQAKHNAALSIFMQGVHLEEVLGLVAERGWPEEVTKALVRDIYRIYGSNGVHSAPDTKPHGTGK